EDPIGLLRPGDAVRRQVAFPVADMRDALGFLEPGLALPQVAKNEERGERVGEPPPDLLEKALLLRRPDTRTRALVQPEDVRLVDLGIHGHGHLGLDAEPLRDPSRDLTLPPRTELHGT